MSVDMRRQVLLRFDNVVCAALWICMTMVLFAALVAVVLPMLGLVDAHDRQRLRNYTAGVATIMGGVGVAGLLVSNYFLACRTQPPMARPVIVESALGV